MTLGFSGTRSGMTLAQRETVLRLLQELQPTKVRHGDCLGSDDEFADICHTFIPRPGIVAHPGVSARGGDNHLRAYNPHSDEACEPKTHFARNRDIVDLSDRIIATPYQPEPQTNGGTWYTINYARKRSKIVYVVNPDGSLS